MLALHEVGLGPPGDTLYERAKSMRRMLKQEMAPQVHQDQRREPPAKKQRYCEQDLLDMLE